MTILSVIAPERSPMIRSCQRGWKNFGEYCYSFHEVQVSWDRAKELCKASNANLVSVHSDEESDFIIDSYWSSATQNTTKCIWTGGKELFESRAWQWDDGSPFNFTNWSSGNPNTVFNPEAPQCICYWRGRYLWSDRPCHHWYSFVCKK